MSAPARASRAAVTDVLEDVDPVIREVAARFARRHRLDPDECLADAYYHFLEAYHEFDPTRGDLEPRVRFIVGARLLDAYRDALDRARRYPNASALVRPAGDGDDAPGFDFARPGVVPFDRDWVVRRAARSRRRDVRTVLRLLTHRPVQLVPQLAAYASLVEEVPPPAPGGPGDLRSLFLYLRSVGWGARRIRATFTEIKEAL